MQWFQHLCNFSSTTGLCLADKNFAVKCLVVNIHKYSAQFFPHDQLSDQFLKGCMEHKKSVLIMILFVVYIPHLWGDTTKLPVIFQKQVVCIFGLDNSVPFCSHFSCLIQLAWYAYPNCYHRGLTGHAVVWLRNRRHCGEAGSFPPYHWRDIGHCEGSTQPRNMPVTHSFKAKVGGAMGGGAWACTASLIEVSVGFCAERQIPSPPNWEWMAAPCPAGKNGITLFGSLGMMSSKKDWEVWQLRNCRRLMIMRAPQDPL